MNFPQTWSQINLKTFNAVDAVLKNNSLADVEKDMQVLCLLSGKSEAEILSLPLSIKHKLMQQLRFLYDLDLACGSHKCIKSKTFWLKGKRFRLIMNVSDLTGGMYIDLMTFLKNPEAISQNIHNVLAVIASPLKWGLFKTRYDGKKQAVCAKFFHDNMPVSIAYPILVFFCNLSSHLTPAIAAYLNRDTMEKMSMVQHQVQDIIKDTDGS